VYNDSGSSLSVRKNVRLDQSRGKESIGTPGSKGVSKEVSKRVSICVAALTLPSLTSYIPQVRKHSSEAYREHPTPPYFE